nr:PREDICTED: uncharacterized protein C12orf40 homolog isoform X2 [Latimeria chalumnae]|eukprot:XP_014347485.1 PREDICTED: uncharacterized protein C12orf40 homolog isoform X2 [Latimeria chalumnae]
MKKKATHVDMNKVVKMPIKRHNIALPMSPCTVPSRICLEEGQYSSPAQGLSTKKVSTSSTGSLKYKLFMPFSEPWIAINEKWAPPSQGIIDVDQQLDQLKYGNSIKLHVPDSRLKSSIVMEASHLQNSCNGFGSNKQRKELAYNGSDNLITMQPGIAQGENTENMNFIQEAALFHTLQSEDTNFVMGKRNNQWLSPLGKQQQILGSTHKMKDVHSTKVPPDRNLESIFTVPKQSFLKNTTEVDILDKRNLQDAQLLQNCLKDYYNQDSNCCFITFEERQQNVETSGTASENQTNIQFLENKKTVVLKNTTINDPTYSSLENFTFPEVLHLAEKEDNAFNLASEFKKDMCVLNNSFLSSQSPSYSPKETDSCFSTGSNVSEDDQSWQQEDPVIKECSQDKFNAQNTSVPNRLLDNTSTSHCSSSTTEDNLYQQKINLGKDDGGYENRDQFVPSYFASTTIKENCYNNDIKTKDAWVQTENFSVCVQKFNVATQCNLNHIGKIVSFPIDESLTDLKCDAESATYTTGGQENQTDELLKPGNKAISANSFLSLAEGEYFSLNDKTFDKVHIYWNNVDAGST